MTKVNRTNEFESYKITVGWIDRFADKLAAGAPPMPTITTAQTEKFATIEEKMQDIKNRVGFNNVLVKKEGGEDIVKKKAQEASSCDCKGPCSCEKKAQVEKILKFIKEIVMNEPELATLAVLERCKNHDGLNFDNIRIDIDKIKKYIDALKSKSPKSTLDTSYIKQQTDSTNREDDMADYYRHGIPDAR